MTGRKSRETVGVKAENQDKQEKLDKQEKQEKQSKQKNQDSPDNQDDTVVLSPDLEKEFLAWKERQLILREKYRETPAGFQNAPEREAAWAKLQSEREEYCRQRRHELEESYAPSDELFVGRESYLDEIRRRFAAGKGPVILCGIGGIGKTAIARAYVRAHQEEYDAVLFLTCGTDLESLICDDTFLKISNLRYSADKYGDKKQYYKEKFRIFAEIAQRIRLLLILDGCNLAVSGKLKQMLSLPCDLLVTTRVNPVLWGMADAGLPVLELQTEEEWRQFYLAYRIREFSPDEMQALRTYRDRVKGHTLLMMMRLHGDNACEDFFSGEALLPQTKERSMQGGRRRVFPGAV